MKLPQRFALIYAYLLSYIHSQCTLENEIFDVGNQQCLKCDLSCKTCYGISSNQCSSCQVDHFRLIDNNTCLIDCPLGMYKDLITMTCGQCAISGCNRCTKDQQCILCKDGLELDEKQNLCKLKMQQCPYPGQAFQVEKNKCVYTCDDNEILDEDSMLCNQMQQCNQVAQYSSSFNLFLRYKGGQPPIVLSNQNFLYLSLIASCQFTLYDKQLDPIQSLLLQSKSIVNKGISVYGDIGLCLNQERIIGYNFITKQVEILIESESLQKKIVSIYPQQKMILYLDQYFKFYTFYNYITNTPILTIEGPLYNSPGYNEIINNSAVVFAISEQNQQGVFRTCIVLPYQSKYFCINQKLYQFKTLSEQDGTFIAQGDQEVKILQLYDNNSQVKELKSISKIYFILDIFIYASKGYITFRYNSMGLNIYQYSIQNNQLNLIASIGDGCQVCNTLCFPFYILNNSNQVLLLIISTSSNFSFINLENGINNLIADLSEIPTTVYPVSQFANSDIQYYQIGGDGGKDIVLYYSMAGFQSFRRTFSIKDVNEIEATQIYSMRKLSTITYSSITYYMKNFTNRLRLTYICLQNTKSWVEFSSNLQSFESLQLSKLQIKQLSDGDDKFYKRSIHFQLDEGFLILQQMLPGGVNCKYYFINTDNDSILFQLSNICAASLSNSFYYIKKRNYLFAFYVYALYNLNSKQRITQFSTNDQIALSKTLIYENFNDDKLLFSDRKGGFYAFDLATLTIQPLINDPSIKLTLFYSFQFRPLSTSTSYQTYLVTINSSIYVQINSAFLQEFSFSTNTLNQSTKITLSAFSKINQFQKNTNVYKNQLIIPNNTTLYVYSQSLNLVDSIQFPYDYTGSEQDYLLIDKYLMLYTNNRIYQLDLSTKTYTGLEIDALLPSVRTIYVDLNKLVIIMSKYALQISTLVITHTFQDNVSSPLKSLQLGQTSIMLTMQNAQEMTLLNNIENSSVISTKFPANWLLLSTAISSDSQIAYYFDSSKKQIIKYNIITTNNDKVYPFSDTYSTFYIDYFQDIFIYKQQDGSLKAFNPNQLSQQIQLIDKFENTATFEFCFNQKIVVVFLPSTNSTKIYNVKCVFIYHFLLIFNLNISLFQQYQDLSVPIITLDQSFINEQLKLSPISQQKPYIISVQCYSNLLYFVSPILRFYTLDGKTQDLSNRFTPNAFSNPFLNQIVNLDRDIVIFGYNNRLDYMKAGKIALISVFPQTLTGKVKMYYDFELDYIVVLAGSLKFIITLESLTQSLKYTFTTNSVFTTVQIDQFLSNQKQVVLIDNSRNIYIYNYLTNEAIQSSKPVQFSGIQSMFVHVNSNVIFLQTSTSIHVYSYPGLLYLESLVDYNNPSKSGFKIMQVVPEINSIFVSRQDSQILVFDLIQTIILPTLNITETLNQEYLLFDRNLILLTSLQHSGLVLGESSYVKDDLLFDISSISSPDTSNLFKLDDSRFMQLSGRYLLIGKINYDKIKIEQIKQQQLQFLFDNFLFDQKNNIFYFTNKDSRQIYSYDLNNQSNGISQLDQLQYNYNMILIYNQYVIYILNNKILKQDLTNLKTTANERIIGGALSISLIMKISLVDNPETYNEQFDPNTQNMFDVIDNSLLFVVKREEKMIFIINSNDLSIISSQPINYEIQKIKVDFKRKIIFCISNILYTFVYDFNLKLLTQLKNPCLLNTKIYLEKLFIYTLCPNLIYFYNAITLERLQYSMEGGRYSDLVRVYSTSKLHTFLITGRQQLSVIQFQGDNLNQIHVVFLQNQRNIKIVRQKTQSSQEGGSYLLVEGIAWDNLVTYTIPIEYTNSIECISELESRGDELNSQLINQINQNSELFQQSLKQVLLKTLNGQSLAAINLQGYTLNSSVFLEQQSSQNKAKLIIQPKNNEENNVEWNDQALASDYFFNYLILRNLKIKISNPISVNWNKNLNKLVMQDLQFIQIDTFTVENGMKDVIFTNIVIKNLNINRLLQSTQQQQNQSINNLSVFSFKDCEKVVLANINVDSTTIGKQILFNFENVKEIYIDNLQVSNSLINNLIRITNSTLFSIKNSYFQNLKGESQTLISGSLISKINLQQIKINNIDEWQFMNVNGCTDFIADTIQITQMINSVFLYTQPYTIDNAFTMTVGSILIKNLQVVQSQNIQFKLFSVYIEISNSHFFGIQQAQSLIESSLSNLTITSSLFENILLDDNSAIIDLNNFNNLRILDCSYQKIDGKVFELQNQNPNYLIELINIKVVNNFKDTFVLSSTSTILIKDSQFEQNSSTEKGGRFMKIENSEKLTIFNSKFTNNKSDNKGGALFISNVPILTIDSSVFEQNQSISESGGGIYIASTTQEILQGLIRKCNLESNNSERGFGGAIGLYKINIKLEETRITNNKAAIGGGIHYEIVIPTIFKENLIEQYKNIITDNHSILYGQNIGSTLRKIKVMKNNFSNSILKYELHLNQESDMALRDQINIINFKSGDYFSLRDIHLIDEEGNNYQENDSILFNQEVKNVILQTSLAFSINKDNSQLKITSDPIQFNMQERSYIFNVSISDQPRNSGMFTLISSEIPSLIDFNSEIIIPQKKLELAFQITFRDCLVGEIKKTFLSSTLCEECPDGKYSLNVADLACKICPQSAAQCSSSSISLKSGYWRENNKTDEIIYCEQSPLNCQPDNPLSKYGCREGYVGPLCQQCDAKGEVWQSRYFNQMSQQFICTKCTTNLISSLLHLIFFILFLTLYLFVCAQRIVTQTEKELICYYLKKSGMLVMSNTGGNPIQIQYGSFDCFYPIEDTDQSIPLWFTRMVYSTCLPIVVILGFIAIKIIKKVFYRQTITKRYFQTALIFLYIYFYPSLVFLYSKSINCVKIGSLKYAQIDLTILCRDFEKHTYFFLIFSLPALTFICLVVPLYLFSNRLSVIQKSSFNFLFKFYKEPFYYWELLRIIYKGVVMIFSIFLSDSGILKACVINTFLISYFFAQIKLNPYQNSFFNYLETQSLLISILTLNMCIMYVQLSEENNDFRYAISSAIILINIYFVSKVLLLAFLKPISSKKDERNKLGECLFKLKQIYPTSFSFIQIQYKTSFHILLKLRHFKKNVSHLSAIAKNTKDFLQKQLISSQTMSLGDFVKQSNTEEQQNLLIPNLKIDIENVPTEPVHTIFDDLLLSPQQSISTNQSPTSQRKASTDYLVKKEDEEEDHVLEDQQ